MEKTISITVPKKEIVRETHGILGMKKMKTDAWNIERRPWADLLEELLGIISKYLNMAEFLTFGRVCRNWRRFVLESMQTSQPPLVFHISVCGKKSCYFYDMSTGIRYVTKLPYFGGNYCLGLSSGYLIWADLRLANRKSNIWVVNPVTGHQLQFIGMPHIQCNRYNYEAKRYSYRAIFASFGSRQDFIVVVISKTDNAIRFCNSRDNNWKVCSFPKKSWCIEGTIVFDGRVFCMTNDYQIGILSLATPTVKFLNLKNSPSRLYGITKFTVSSEELMIINFDFRRMQLYKIDFAKREWVKEENLGDAALFIGDSRSSSGIINTTNWGGRSNFVYQLSLYQKDCCIYSLNSKELESFPVIKEDSYYQKISSWYFLNQCYTVDYVRDDDDVDDSKFDFL